MGVLETVSPKKMNLHPFKLYRNYLEKLVKYKRFLLDLNFSELNPASKRERKMSPSHIHVLHKASY